MKKILSLAFIAILLASSFSYAQDQRSRTLNYDKYRDYIENHAPSAPADNYVGGYGDLIFAENFDNTGGQLPAGWVVFGNSQTCKWNVDATPAAPGFYSASYSLNYNNGTNFNCGANWGFATTGLIETGGASLDISFWLSFSNECGGGIWCYWDKLYVIILNENDIIIDYAQIGGSPAWSQVNYQFMNANAVQKVKISFYFDTVDDIANNYYGPFIDDLEVRLGPIIPVSGWALAIGITLIAAFTFFRYRRMA